jgi:hypothetical protein
MLHASSYMASPYAILHMLAAVLAHSGAPHCPYVLLSDKTTSAPNTPTGLILGETTGLFKWAGRSQQDDDSADGNAIPYFKKIKAVPTDPALVFCWHGGAKSWVVSKNVQSRTYLLAAKLGSLSGKQRKHAMFHPNKIPTSVKWFSFGQNGGGAVNGVIRIDCLSDIKKATLCHHGFKPKTNCEHRIAKLTPVFWPWFPKGVSHHPMFTASASASCQTVKIHDIEDSSPGGSCTGIFHFQHLEETMVNTTGTQNLRVRTPVFRSKDTPPKYLFFYNPKTGDGTGIWAVGPEQGSSPLCMGTTRGIEDPHHDNKWQAYTGVGKLQVDKALRFFF